MKQVKPNLAVFESEKHDVEKIKKQIREMEEEKTLSGLVVPKKRERNCEVPS